MTARDCLLSLKQSRLFLPVLVPLVEFVNAAGGVDDLDFAGVEGMGCVGNLNLHEGILDSVNNKGLLGGGAGTGDENVLV